MTVVEIPVKGGSLRGDDVGEGRPAVLVHGFALDRRMWAHQVPALAESARVLAYDLRGFGESSPSDAGRHHVDDLVEVLDHLGAAEADLIGLSLGANVALAAAVTVPKRVRRIVLASPGLAGHRWREPRPPDAALKHARAHGVDAAKAFWLGHPLFASLDHRLDARAAVRSMVDDYDGGHWRGLTAAPLPPVTLEDLASLTVPTLVVNGARDVAGYREIGEVVAAAAGAERVVLADSGHMAPMEQATDFTAAVRRFLTS